MKHVVLITEMLWNPIQGIAKQTIWYSDGSTEERFIPKYPPIFIQPLFLEGV